MLTLENKDWKTFKVEKLFSIEKCKCSKAGDLKKGNIPYIGATNRNNGLMSFVEKNKKLMTQGNCITFICDGQGSVGYSIYKYENFIGSTTLKIGRNNKLNKYNGLFFTTLLDMNKSIYDYGYKRNDSRLKKETIIIPSNNEKPDYEYMENYTKSIIDKKLEDYKKYARNVLSNLEYKKIEPLENKEWEKFVIEDLFDIKIGKSIDGNKIDKLSGKIPYITRKEVNNGYDGFISYNKEYLYKNIPVITIGNETATPFIQTSSFFTGTKVNIMKSKENVSENILFFIAQSIKQQKSKYSYTITINSTRLKKQAILLPINKKNEPDYEYMEQYIQNVKYKKINQYLDYLQKQNIEK